MFAPNAQKRRTGQRGKENVGSYAWTAPVRARANVARPVASQRPDQTAQETEAILADVPACPWDDLRVEQSDEHPSVGSVSNVQWHFHATEDPTLARRRRNEVTPHMAKV